MLPPHTHVLSKIFVQGFYRAHAGMFLFFFLVMIGAVDPGQLLGYHKTLILAFVTSPLMLLVVFGVWLLYAIKTWHYVTKQITAPTQHFLFYSSNAFNKAKQFKSWLVVQGNILLPVITYGLLAIGVGITYEYYLNPLLIAIYLFLLTGIGAWLSMQTVNRLVNSNSNSWLFRLTSRFKKPFFSLYIYHVFNRMQISCMITKVLSWLIITTVFYLFDDVKHDERVAGMAVLAIAVAHSVLVFEEQCFETVYLNFAKNYPYTIFKRFSFVCLAYMLLIAPEGIWLFSRFNAALAAQLLIMALGIIMLLHSLLYYIGLNMDRYLQWVLGLFIILFWVMMFKLIPAIIIISLVGAYLLYAQFYYRDTPSSTQIK